MAVILGLFGYRRRRLAQSNLTYIHHPGQGNAYGNPYGYNGGGPPPFGPQYPPQAHGPPGPYGYDPATGFAPVRDCGHSPVLSPFLLTSSTLSPTHRHRSTTRHHLVRPQSRHQSEIMPVLLIYAGVNTLSGFGSLAPMLCRSYPSSHKLLLYSCGSCTSRLATFRTLATTFIILLFSLCAWATAMDTRLYLSNRRLDLSR
jgi:hypothetical protein